MKMRIALVMAMAAVLALMAGCQCGEKSAPCGQSNSCAKKCDSCPKAGQSMCPNCPMGGMLPDRMAMLQKLERPGDYETHRESSFDRNWENGNADARPIEPGQTLTLAEIDGPGRITHIWFTINAEDPYYPRSLVLRMYWDGRDEPSVECPIGDFFAVGHGMSVPVNTFPVQVSSEGRARNCYWPMPFGKSARITVSNDSPDKKVHSFYYYIDYQKLPRLPEDTMYFHAQYRQEFPTKMGTDYLIFDGQGDGVYVGTVLSIHSKEASWYGEGDDRFYIDGAEKPTLHGTGLEDYFCDAWGFRQFNNPFYGVTVLEGYEPGDRTTAYRWHIPDPVRFHKSLKLFIEHKGVVFDAEGKTRYDEREDNYSSAAFWYQRGIAKRYAEIPPVSERIVQSHMIDAAALVGTDAVRAEPANVQVQGGPPWTGKGQLFFTPVENGGWVEVDFDVPAEGTYAIKLAVTKSFDYGTYDVMLDGEKVLNGMDLYNASISRQVVGLGGHQLSAGKHTLRFNCVDSNPQSKMAGTEKPGHFLGLDDIELYDVMERK